MQLPSGKNPFKKLSSELLYERPYVRFMKEKVEVAGQVKDYSFAQINNGIGIVAINDKNEVVLVGQWRYPIDEYSWEIPAGMREENEDPLETAKRELREEAGVIAKKWTALGSFYMECSSTNKESFAFLAEDLELGEGNPDDDEEIESRWLPLEEALKKVASGEIKDGLTCLGLLRAQSILRV